MKLVDVIGYEGLYKISEYGDVYNVKTQCFLKHSLGWYGHHLVTLRKDNKSKQIAVHRLVALTFIRSNDIDGLVVDHIDANKDNNHVSNLRWCTQKENVHNCIAHGNFGKMRKKEDFYIIQ